MCMTCAGQAPAAAASLSGLLAYGTVAGAAALGAVGLGRRHSAGSPSGLEALGEVGDRPGPRAADVGSADDERTGG
jgi:hypothetical protein